MTAATPRTAPDRRSRAAAVAGAPAALARRTPLRVKLVAMLMVLVAVALTAAGLAATNALRHYLLGRVDDQLTASVQGLQEHRWPPGDPDRDIGPGPLPSANASYIAFTNAQGRGPAQLYADTVSSQSAPRLPTLTTSVVARHDGTPFTVPAAGAGADWRVLVTAFPDGSGAVTVATTLNDVEDTLGKLRRVELVVGLMVLAATGVLGYVVVRSSLRPLVTVEKTAEAIAAGDLSRRVPEADERTEVGRLSNSLNSMLSQIETAFEAQGESEAAAKASEDRMRQFVADASHELRTPLTSIRGFAELYRHGAVPEADLERVMGRIEGEATRMGLLVEDLLLLARMDEQRPLEAVPVDLLQLAADAVHDARAVAPDHTLRLVTGSPGGAAQAPAVVVGDEARLRQVLANLTSNGVTHTPAGTTVTVTVRTDGDDAVVEVSDDGPGLSPEKAAHVFERFYRTDSARSRARGGSGLGLSIVSALVAAHGGRIDLATDVGRGVTFTVRLPLWLGRSDPESRPGLGAGTPSGRGGAGASARALAGALTAAEVLEVTPAARPVPRRDAEPPARKSALPAGERSPWARQ